MKLYTILPPGLFALVFLWMLGNYFCQPDEPEPPPTITAPALHGEPHG